MQIREPHGCMVVDIGGGSTDIAVISMGGRVRAASVPVAGNAFDRCIAQYVQEKYQIAIGPLTAEALKKQVACCTKSEFEGVMEVRGHSWETNLPARRLIYTHDLYEPVQELATRIAAAARTVLESTPPELAADVSSTGVLLTGGGSLLRGLASYLAGELHVDVAIAPDPINCVARVQPSVSVRANILPPVSGMQPLRRGKKRCKMCGTPFLMTDPDEPPKY